jgi:hypothetical protein
MERGIIDGWGSFSLERGLTAVVVNGAYVSRNEAG